MGRSAIPPGKFADDADAVYGEVPLPYRDPATCGTLPETPYDSNQRRAALPRRAGVGTPAPGIYTRLKMTPVAVLNGRRLLERGEVPSMDKHSFMYARQATSFRDWDDPDAVRDRYFPEVEALVRAQVPGAGLPGARVLIFDHALRTKHRLVSDKARAAPLAGWGGYANLVHTDATVRSIHTRCKDQVLGTTETVVKYNGVYPAGWGDVRPTREWQRRLFRAEKADHDSSDGTGGEHFIVNVWRPTAGPVRNWGLAVMDGSTLRQGDVHPTILTQFDNSPGGRIGGGADGRGIEPAAAASKVVDVDGRPVPVRVGESLTPLHHPAHRWIYYPDMRPDEALLLKVFDSRRDGRTRCGCHTAFRDPGAPDAHRESIEVRCLVILPPGDTVPTYRGHMSGISMPRVGFGIKAQQVGELGALSKI